MKWIGVKDKLPVYGERVLMEPGTYINTGLSKITFREVTVGERKLTNHLGDWWELEGIAGFGKFQFDGHWMPLPESPEEE